MNYEKQKLRSICYICIVNYLYNKLMVTVVKKGSDKESFDQALKDLNQKENKGFNAKRFCGVIKFKEDAQHIQKRLRDEWE